MPRPATGSVVPPKGDRKSWAVRFTVNGKRQIETLGTPEQGWTQKKAEEARDNIMADVRRGIWKRPEPSIQVNTPAAEGETFHEFAEEWFAHREPALKPNTLAGYKKHLELHLLPYFGGMTLSGISIEHVDKFAVAKQREGRLSNNTINTSLMVLAMVLRLASEWGRIPTNPAEGKQRRLKGEPRKRLHVQPEQLPSLLEACKLEYRPLIATLALAGLRISEAIALTWDDVNLATGTLRVNDSKTPAGIRVVDMPRGLVDELRELKARTHVPLPTNQVFRNVGGRKPMTDRNAQARIKGVITKANVKLRAVGIEEIDEGVSCHSLRRLYASLRFGAGDDVVYVSEQIGHTNPTFSMKVYAKAIKRRDRLAGDHLREFDKAVEMARIGTEPQTAISELVPDRLPERF